MCVYIRVVNSGYEIFQGDPYIDPIFDVESIGDGPRVPRAHLEVVLTQLLASPVQVLQWTTL